jgi:molybdopterin/thiamine biosynthesis adenylyltransferase
LSGLDTSRIDYLLDHGAAAAAMVTVVGVGSGGAAVLQNLAMCGIRHWHVFDPDILEPENLVKHPALRRDIGRPKVEIMADWLADRNPAASVRTYQENVIDSAAFDAAVAESDIVVCATDTRKGRRYVNERCVAARTPCTTGSVLRTGLGGEIFLYVPGVTGCFACLEQYCDLTDRNLDDLVPLTSEEETHRYGLSEREFAASGLITDIAMIAALHATITLGALVGGRTEYLPPPRFNWLIFGIRELPGAFKAPYSVTRLVLGPQDDCEAHCARTT